MTINIAFKQPDAVVFATDGLSSLIDVDPTTGTERIVASVPHAEKLVLLSNDAAHAPLLAMFNGVGSLGNGSIAAELRQFDRANARDTRESVDAYCRRLNDHLLRREQTVRRSEGRSPRPLHVIVAGFDRLDGVEDLPTVFEIKWAVGAELPKAPSPVLHERDTDGFVHHRYGTYYAGATEAVSRFVEGFDPALRDQAFDLLLGAASPTAPPGILEELVQEARRAGDNRLPPLTSEDMKALAEKYAPMVPPRIVEDLAQEARRRGNTRLPPLSNLEVQALAEKYADRVVAALFRPEVDSLSEHFSLQAAVNYCAFLAHCAHARENWSPARKGPPRIGAPLQVACLTRDAPPRLLSEVKLGVAYREFDGGLS